MKEERFVNITHIPLHSLFPDKVDISFPYLFKFFIRSLFFFFLCNLKTRNGKLKCLEYVQAIITVDLLTSRRKHHRQPRCFNRNHGCSHNRNRNHNNSSNTCNSMDHPMQVLYDLETHFPIL